jgi:hypothetical protein
MTSHASTARVRLKIAVVRARETSMCFMDGLFWIGFPA